jgi:prophage tail gpP-like protein
MPSSLELKVDGQFWTGWKSVQVTQSLETAASSFTVLSKTRDPWPVRAGAKVEIHLERELVLAGYVDKTAPVLDDGGSLTSIEGRSRTGDLVDCSALTEPGEWWNARLQDLAAEIARPFGIGVVDVVGELERFPVFRIQPGETAFEAIERACRMRAVLTYPTAAGDLLLTRPTDVWDGVELREGFNVQSCSAEEDFSNRFAEYIVRGQSFGTDENYGPPAAHPEGTARDMAVRGERRLVIIAETAVSLASAQARAEWEAAFRAAKSSKVTVSAAGWLNNRGYLWAPNTRVQCHLPSIRITGPRLVSAVRLSQSEDGSKVELDLVREDAFVPQPDLEEEANPFQDLAEEEFAGGDQDEGAFV